MTKPQSPKTRLKQLLDKTFNTEEEMTADEQLLDFRAGLYEELIESEGPADVREIMAATIDVLRQEGADYVAQMLPASVAASITLSEKMMTSQNSPEEKASEIFSKVSPVFGARPAQFTGIAVQTVAEIMERDLDLPALEKSFRRFGFDVKDGVIGAWTGPAPQAPKASAPPPRIG